MPILYDDRSTPTGKGLERLARLAAQSKPTPVVGGDVMTAATPEQEQAMEAAFQPLQDPWPRTPSWLGIPDWMDNPVTRFISGLGEAMIGDVQQLGDVAEVYTKPETYAAVADPEAWANLPGEALDVAKQVGYDWFVDPIGYAQRDPLFAMMDLVGLGYAGRPGGLLDKAVAASGKAAERVSGALGDIASHPVYNRLRSRLASETGTVDWGGMGETLTPEEMAAREAAPAREMLTDADLDILMDTEPITVVVTGSRGWTDAEAIANDINRLPPGSTVIHGGAKGADTIAANAALARGDLIVRKMPADWATHGRSAGMRRNAAMMDLMPDEVLAYWDQTSPGTANAIAAARRRGIPVRGVGVPPPPPDIPGIPAYPGNLATRLSKDWAEALTPEEIKAVTQAKTDFAESGGEPFWPEVEERQGYYGEYYGPDEAELTLPIHVPDEEVSGFIGVPPPMQRLASGEVPVRWRYYDDPFASPHQLEFEGQRFKTPSGRAPKKAPYSLRELILRRGESELAPASGIGPSRLTPPETPRQPPTYSTEQAALIESYFKELAELKQSMRAPESYSIGTTLEDLGSPSVGNLPEQTWGSEVRATEVGMEPELPSDIYASTPLAAQNPREMGLEARLDTPADLFELERQADIEPLPAAPTHLQQMTTPEQRALNKWLRDEARMRRLAVLEQRERAGAGLESLTEEPRYANWNPVTEEWELTDIHSKTAPKWSEFPGWGATRKPNHPLPRGWEGFGEDMDETVMMNRVMQDRLPAKPRPERLVPETRSTLQRLKDELQARGHQLLIDDTGAVSLRAEDWTFNRRDAVTEQVDSRYYPGETNLYQQRTWDITSKDGQYAGTITFHWRDETPEIVHVDSMNPGQNVDMFYNPELNNLMGAKGLTRVLREVIQAENPYVEKVEWLAVNSGANINAQLADRPVALNIPSRYLNQPNLFRGEDYRVPPPLPEEYSSEFLAPTYEDVTQGLQSLQRINRGIPVQNQLPLEWTKPFLPWDPESWMDLYQMAEETPTGTPVPGWTRAGTVPHNHSVQEIATLANQDTHRAIMTHLFGGHDIPEDIAMVLLVGTEDLGAVDAWHALEHLPNEQLPPTRYRAVGDEYAGEASLVGYDVVAPESMRLLFDEQTRRPLDFSSRDPNTDALRDYLEQEQARSRRADVLELTTADEIRLNELRRQLLE